MQIEVIPMLINSDFMEVSLDVLMYLADYKMYGESSFVYQDKSKLYKVYEASNISMNDSKVNGEALDYLLKTQNAGEVLTLIHELGQKEQIRKLSTMSTIANNATAMAAVLNSNTATVAITNSSTAMQAVASSSVAMQAVLASSTAIIAIMNSSERLNEKMLTIMGKSKVALDTFKNSETAMVKFNNLSDALRAKFADEVEKKNINHAYYTSGHIIQAPMFLCEYTNGQGYSSGGNGGVGKSIITLAGESAQQNISVKNKFITDFDYNSGALVSNNYGFPQYCKNVSIICA